MRKIFFSVPGSLPVERYVSSPSVAVSFKEVASPAMCSRINESAVSSPRLRRSIRSWSMFAGTLSQDDGGFGRKGCKVSRVLLLTRL